MQFSCLHKPSPRTGDLPRQNNLDPLPIHPTYGQQRASISVLWGSLGPTGTHLTGTVTVYHGSTHMGPFTRAPGPAQVKVSIGRTYGIYYLRTRKSITSTIPTHAFLMRCYVGRHLLLFWQGADSVIRDPRGSNGTGLGLSLALCTGRLVLRLFLGDRGSRRNMVPNSVSYVVRSNEIIGVRESEGSSRKVELSLSSFGSSEGQNN